MAEAMVIRELASSKPHPTPVYIFNGAATASSEVRIRLAERASAMGSIDQWWAFVQKQQKDWDFDEKQWQITVAAAERQRLEEEGKVEEEGYKMTNESIRKVIREGRCVTRVQLPTSNDPLLMLGCRCKDPLLMTLAACYRLLLITAHYRYYPYGLTPRPPSSS